MRWLYDRAQNLLGANNSLTKVLTHLLKLPFAPTFLKIILYFSIAVICSVSMIHLATMAPTQVAHQAGSNISSSAQSNAWMTGTNRPSASLGFVQKSGSKGRRVSRAKQSEVGQFGNAEVVDVGDDTNNFADFLVREAQAAFEHEQRCLLVTTLPKCPSCAALGYALARTSLKYNLGKIRLIRSDLEEFEEELRALQVPLDRVPGFMLIDKTGKFVDFLDAREWNTNNPAEFGPILGSFVRGTYRHSRRHFGPVTESLSIDL
jgi:hypothetical protein